MRARGLIDTGAMLAYLDSRDHWHSKCREAFGSLPLPLGTTTAVLAEFLHLLGRHPRDVEAAWRFLQSGAITILPITDHDLPEVNRLMTRYADRPMDFADATLVRVGSRHNLTTIFTIDFDDFETYRMERKRKFRIVPSR